MLLLLLRGHVDGVYYFLLYFDWEAIPLWDYDMVGTWR